MSTNEFAVRKLSKADLSAAVGLAWCVFLEFEAPEYKQAGVDEFRRFLDEIPENKDLQMLGAFANNTIVGLIAVRPPCHISLLFVDKAHHRRGIARLLWETILNDKAIIKNNEPVSVNSSPYAVPIYQRLGFTPTSEEQTVNGIRFVPMRFLREGESL